MSAFSSILTELEGSTSCVGRSATPCGQYDLFRARLEQYGEPQEIAAFNGPAATAYAMMRSVAGPEPWTSPPSPAVPNEPSPWEQAALRLQLGLASGSLSRLKALRRKLARRWHPDLNPEAPGQALLAELNARIDAEIKTLAGGAAAK